MRFARLLAILPLLAGAREAPAEMEPQPRTCDEAALRPPARTPRTVRWAESLDPIDMKNLTSRETASVRLYALDGAIDPREREAFERVAANGDAEAHELAPRLEQLVVKAAYHFGGKRILVVSGWRAHAGRHGTGEALDFKLEGVRAATLAAYLRGLPRVGVGIYTHPRTQFVHLDVREPSYFWIDASPPGVKWREARIGDRGAAARDASWTAEMDLPSPAAR